MTDPSDLCSACAESAMQNETYETVDQDTGGCEHGGCPWRALQRAEARCEQLEADCVVKDAALKWVEAVMSIVEPRSDKAEYLECLAAVRKALQDNPGAALLAVVEAARLVKRTPFSYQVKAREKLYDALDTLDGQKEPD